MEALEAGAVEVISKPGPAYSVGDACDDLIEKIKSASKARINKHTVYHSTRRGIMHCFRYAKGSHRPRSGSENRPVAGCSQNYDWRCESLLVYRRSFNSRQVVRMIPSLSMNFFISRSVSKRSSASRFAPEPEMCENTSVCTVQ